MRILPATLAALLLITLTACGSGTDKTTEPAPAPKTEATEAAVTEPDACTRLARTWAVTARALDTALLLMVEDRINGATDAMKAATDEMEIEGCTGPVRESATMGNYQASVAAFEVRICVIHELTTCDKAHDKWKKDGSPVVARVRTLSGLE